MKLRFVKQAFVLVSVVACVSSAEQRGAAAAAGGKASAAEPAWVTQSNRLAKPLLDVIVQYTPESASGMGVEGHDGDIMDMRPQYTERYAKSLEDVARSLEAQRAAVSDARIKADLEILIATAHDNRESMLLNRRLLLPYADMARALFGSFHTLLDPRIDEKRRAFALARLRKYTGTEKGFEPIVSLARSDYELQAKDASLVAPWGVEVKQSLENRKRYTDGIRDLFVQSGLDGWQADLDKLVRQLEEYNQWIAAAVLPKARPQNRLPPEIYADNLKNYGVRAQPEELMEAAFVGFMQTRDEMQSVARTLAEKRGLPSARYTDVIRELKKARIPNDQLLPIYKGRLREVEELLRRERLITLPKREAVIRLATEAESAAIPAPHLSPPRLIGNTGEPSEFVLPTHNPNAQPGAEMDDFNYDGVTWGLVVHEARPGHELQFASMVENGVSIARGVFALNSANIEGWGLYSEAVMKAYLPLEGQLGILQFRLMRAARAFLDPMLNLGLIEPDAAKRLLIEDVALSEPMAKQEIDRYTFQNPGQATSYFYGYQRLAALRTKVEIALGGHFSTLAYHDFIMTQGLLPLELLEKAVLTEFVPAQRAKAPAGG